MMMIRSSSTPILGSLLSSESPNNNNNNNSNSSHTPNHTFHPHHHNNKKLPFHQNQQTPPRHSLHSSSTNYYNNSSSTNYYNNSSSTNYYNNSSCTTFHSSSSPISPSIADHANRTPPTGFRRAQSEGNLEQLYSANDLDEFNNPMIPPISFLRMKAHYSSVLQPIPSFSYSRSRDEEENEDDYADSEEGSEEPKETCDEEDKVSAMKGDQRLSWEDMEKSFNAAYDASDFGDNYGGHSENFDSKMHIARGPGVDVIDGFGVGGGGDGWNVNRHPSSGGGGHGDDTTSEANDMDEFYKRMVDENPGNALLLRNYADFLHKSKNDLKGAEEYYSRSILADPTDGEVLSQYAKLVWKLHRDEDRATGYFERAVQTAPEDSHVHAAYASFLWEIEAEDVDDVQNDLGLMAPGDRLREGGMATVGA